MGKRIKKKAPNPRRAMLRAPVASTRSADQKAEVVGEHEGERGGCDHYSRSIDELNRTLLSVRSSMDYIAACEHCREEPVNRRGSKEKGKQQKKKGAGRASEPKKDSNFIWVCLDCNRSFCGGDVIPWEPYGHARRHSKQEHHMWAVRSDDPLISWCYSCNSTLAIEMPKEEMDVTPKVTMSSGNVDESQVLEISEGYVVRGLSNLGNTCFFNSVMQNLLATDILRNYLASLDPPLGPITMSLKKLFAETSSVVDSKNVLSPKALFGSICANAPQFKGYQQQDSHELLRYLLDGLHMEEISSRKIGDSFDEQEEPDSGLIITFVDYIFGGQISSTVCCRECGHTSIVHEPFLDLSLPVPSKRPPPKKVPPLPPKRSKAPLKESNKGRRFGEKVVTKGAAAIQHCKAESSDATPELNNSSGPALKPEAAVAVPLEDSIWMTYIGAPAPQGSDTEEFVRTENTKQDTTNLQLVDYSRDLNVSAVSRGEASCGDEFSSSCNQDPKNSTSCVQDPNMSLLPYKGTGPTAEAINDPTSCSQTAENVAFLTVDNVASQSADNEPSVNAPSEVDFDGFGDLFNEPEVTSGPRAENGTGEELDMTLWTANGSDSNHDEVDNTNAPVSVNSCLALFTKPEVLSDEQAWHCDRCSQNAAQTGEKLKIMTVVDDNSGVEEGESRGKDISATVKVNSTEPKYSGNGKMTSSLVNFVSHNEKTDQPPTELQKPLDGDSDSEKEIQNERGPNIPESHMMRKDEELGTSDGSSQYFSCQSSHENCVRQERSFNQETDYFSVNDAEGVDSIGYDRPVADASGRNDSTNETNQLAKEGWQASDEGHSLDSNGSKKTKGEITKVKRDAIKRILINRSPPVLTIHLKRFSQDARGRLIKLNGHVSFQDTLDLRPYMDPRSKEKDKCLYRLTGVVEHSGSMHGGHYIAYVRGERGQGKMQKSTGQAWFYTSDAHVREASFSEVLKSDAYILFYERVDV